MIIVVTTIVVMIIINNVFFIFLYDLDLLFSDWYQNIQKADSGSSVCSGVQLLQYNLLLMCHRLKNSITI